MYRENHVYKENCIINFIHSHHIIGCLQLIVGGGFRLLQFDEPNRKTSSCQKLIGV